MNKKFRLKRKKEKTCFKEGTRIEKQFLKRVSQLNVFPGKREKRLTKYLKEKHK